ncbi:triosephosphate isomerase [Planctobacterium marinum]|uniref:Triosephosphate isomerase n=2 Tax=Planctobacterium marinum TaxID=1631968 RepID=A0AA48KU36_9ALTE|nr:triosephosphate isomerase [Planctobacterium marinum]
MTSDMATERKSLVAGNWKLNGSSALVNEMNQALNACDFKDTQVVVCVPSVYLGQFSASSFDVGAQDVSSHESGAYTGEVSADMLAECGAKWVIVGHSERRTYHAESNAVVAQKAQRALEAGLIPIVCFGEEESIRDSGDYVEHCVKQVAVVVEHLGIERFAQCVLAYEPVWAIGTGKTASPEQAQEVHQKVREFIAQKSAEVADGMRILYGGSVKADNASELFSQPDVDGGLIGGASLKADDFKAICQSA